MSSAASPEVTGAPRLVEVDLTALGTGRADAVRRTAWRSDDPVLGAIGAWGGPACGLALCALAEPDAVPFVVAVGGCVRRALPTAARASVLARSPLTGRLSEGLVGSELARRLASVTDALALTGRAGGAGDVLHVAAEGRIELLSLPELAGLDPAATHARIAARLGPCATLRVGAAGEAGVPFANLAAGEDPPSYVGRSGLGAALGARGLKAIAVSAPPVEHEARPGEERLVRALLSSPRLLARAEGGTLELVHAFGARGDLRARGYREPVDSEAAARLGDQARAAGRGRHGCRGCPTPCGWVFERPGGDTQGARFSAVYALGTNLGLDGFDDAMALLAVCNELGVDAKEAGAALALFARASERGTLAGPAPWGDRARFEELLRELVAGRGEGARLRGGAARFASEVGLAAEAATAGGEAARPESSLAAVLGACAGARGPEPMRTFPFLVGDAAGRARIAALLAPLPVPEGTDDPRSPAGKGRCVWWHENLVAAVDATGFCAFSAAGLVADGALDLDGLAEWIEPPALAATPGMAGRAPGQRLLAMGASLVLLHLEIARRLGSPAPPAPEWARALLELPGMLDEYRALRGLDGEGRVGAEARARLGTAGLLELVDLAAPPASSRAPRGPAPGATDRSDRSDRARAEGTVTLRTAGRLADRLGARAAVRVALPASVSDVLAAAAARWPAAAAELVRDGEPVAAVYRGGQKLAGDGEVRAGDVLDLVLVVSGG